MRLYQPKDGVRTKSIKEELCFAWLPLTIERPHRGYLWLEFYARVYEYYNGSWHFMGKLHRDFEQATMEDNTGKIKTVHWHYPNIYRKILYFIRCLLVLIFWTALILGAVLFIHKYS